MSEKKRKCFTGKFKSKVAIEAIRGIKTVNEIAQEFGVHPTQVGLWEKNCTSSLRMFLILNAVPSPIRQLVQSDSTLR